MKKFFTSLVVSALALFLAAPSSALAAAGISASGGGSFTVGQQFTVTVTASGGEFDSLQGSFSVSGPVSVVSVSPGGATWLPGKKPDNGVQFVGITNATSSLQVAKIVLKGTKEGTGTVSVNGVKLAFQGSIVGTSAGGANFTIKRAPTPPGSVTVTSSSHPDQAQAYENTTIDLAWVKASNGASNFSFLLDQKADTVPSADKTSTDLSVSYPGQAVGSYYFHIRAKNNDGWGPTNHFKVTIKEPDAKIDTTLLKPTVTKIEKTSTYKTNLEDGTLTGITLAGTGQPNFKMNLSFSPALDGVAPEALSTTADATGLWTLTLGNPVKAGFYRLTVQGQQEKVLTPISDAVRMEVSIAKAGNVQLITAQDGIPTPVPSPAQAAVQASRSKLTSLVWVALFALVVTGVVGLVTRAMIARRTLKESKQSLKQK